ncbi:MoaD/ThiS family protein [Aliidiomarina sp.]|uniref:MoaD/ThiS family protein n=1 Tax=Aliidiomarina sp. TaxID=1872439 RepID=UPI003A4DF66C
MVKVLFFAALRERLKSSEYLLADFQQGSVADVLAAVSAHSERWREVLASQQLLMAVNQQLVDAAATVKTGDEVAFFPPVTGG